jgi:NAD dependent epimerase/dehydratase
MKVLVTGADGFIGSHLTELLLKQGYEVKALCQYNSFNNWGWLEGINQDNLEIICGDVRDSYFCKSLVKDVKIIFHLAALIAIPYSYAAPESYIETNVIGTLNICQAALEHNVERVIISSTSEVYGTAMYVPIDEKHPKQAQSPYSASKIGADALAMSFFNSFNLPLTIARPFNTYGPRQSARAIIPTIISQIASGEKLIKVGDLSPTRDFNYVQDTCLGFLAIAQNDNCIGEEINIASNFEISMKDTLQLIAKTMKKDVTFIEEIDRIRPPKSEVYRLWGCNDKIVKLTGFSPQFNIEQGISETINWFSNEENLNRYKPQIYNV